MQFCRQRGCEVAVDLVPHDLYDRLSLSELQQLTNDSTIIISEVQTLNGFTTGHQSGILNLKDALASSSNIRHLLPNRWLLLKFGIGNMDQFLVVSPAGKACSGYTGFRDLSDTTGFGDRVTAKELYLILTSGIEGWAEPKIDLNREHNIP
ncbi:hypothetical protein FHS01_000361 [Longimicrobium terrae]|uniref:Uncharacterized protein n=2 Tax=Longimicrobium terrae TaxID=1639882 RepID=A0A841GVE7_9BACT|nr:hypothetical protein [Longimicrobium terrae]MBB6068755.1 hypothetical protein [Longimicrobium terrae]